MPPLYKCVLNLLVVMFIGGCATPSPLSINRDTAQRFKRVAVVSTVGDVFTRIYIGVTVFNNMRDERQVPEWRVDRTLEELFENEIRKHDLTVVETDTPRNAFSPVNGKKGPEWDAVASIVKAQCSKHALDGMFIINKGFESRGMHVFYWRAERQMSFGFTARLALLDCGSGLPIAERPLFDGTRPIGQRALEKPMPTHWPPSGPWQQRIYDEARAEILNWGRLAVAPTLEALMSAR